MKLRSKTFIAFIVLAAIYASASLIAAPPRTSLQQYHVSSTTLRLLNGTVVFPVIGIWFIGLYGYQKLRTYTTYVRGNKEGARLVELTRGIMILAWWLPISSTLSALLNHLAHAHPEWQTTTTIILNYVAVLFPLAAFWFISRGSRQLSELSRERPKQNSIHLMALVLIAGSLIYGTLIAAARDKLWTIYHLPLLLVMVTLAIPYIFTWYLGLLAVFDLHVYTRKVKGIVYKRSWNNVAFGVIWVVITCVALQFTTAVSARLGSLTLGWALVLIYGLLVTMTVGYLFIAVGAKRLTRIEEV